MQEYRSAGRGGKEQVTNRGRTASSHRRLCQHDERTIGPKPARGEAMLIHSLNGHGYYPCCWSPGSRLIRKCFRFNRWESESVWTLFTSHPVWHDRPDTCQWRSPGGPKWRTTLAPLAILLRHVPADVKAKPLARLRAALTPQPGRKYRLLKGACRPPEWPRF